jgi:hypothetical protein
VLVQYVLPVFFGHAIVPHASAAEQVVSHLHASMHLALLHAALAMHWMSQLPLLPPPQLTSPHAFAAVHFATQLSPLHVMSLHADAALHVISHCDPDEHVMLPHAFAAPQVITHLMLSGHVKLAPLVPVTVQTFGEWLVSQLVHCVGQAELSITQKPSSHTRGAVQFVLSLHASVSLLRSTKHALPAHAPMMATAASAANVWLVMGRSGTQRLPSDRTRCPPRILSHTPTRASDTSCSHTPRAEDTTSCSCTNSHR